MRKAPVITFGKHKTVIAGPKAEKAGTYQISLYWLVEALKDYAVTDLEVKQGMFGDDTSISLLVADKPKTEDKV